MLPLLVCRVSCALLTVVWLQCLLSPGAVAIAARELHISTAKSVPAADPNSDPVGHLPISRGDDHLFLISSRSGNGCNTGDRRSAASASELSVHVEPPRSARPGRFFSSPVLFKVKSFAAAAIGTLAIIYLVMRCTGNRGLPSVRGQTLRALSDSTESSSASDGASVSSDVESSSEGDSGVSACDVLNVEERPAFSAPRWKISEEEVHDRASLLFKEARDLMASALKVLPLFRGPVHNPLTTLLIIVAQELASVRFHADLWVQARWSPAMGEILESGRKLVGSGEASKASSAMSRGCQNVLSFLESLAEHNPEKNPREQEQALKDLLAAVTMARAAFHQCAVALSVLLPWTEAKAQKAAGIEGRGARGRKGDSRVIPKELEAPLTAVLTTVQLARREALLSDPELSAWIEVCERKLRQKIIANSKFGRAATTASPLVAQMSELLRSCEDPVRKLRTAHDDAFKSSLSDDSTPVVATKKRPTRTTERSWAVAVRGALRRDGSQTSTSSSSSSKAKHADAAAVQAEISGGQSRPSRKKRTEPTVLWLPPYFPMPGVLSLAPDGGLRFPALPLIRRPNMDPVSWPLITSSPWLSLPGTIPKTSPTALALEAPAAAPKYLLKKKALNPDAPPFTPKLTMQDRGEGTTVGTKKKKHDIVRAPGANKGPGTPFYGHAWGEPSESTGQEESSDSGEEPLT
ncbi:hypothetical protein, conserved [Eimeria tenella]|uniref:Transmembrane protein n=1 Tax=Eimeria tenella TaxID=5802 RepID=U6KL04_EIMTE|nr:hypothetical protein, conserved [Eimeria tenella]CDJ36932.1 hypothetical protein, conserved [Eimeria tenella]|eukprot:XP_013227770.1 hypothetical protein, conserved [Eimeria tenella]